MISIASSIPAARIAARTVMALAAAAALAACGQKGPLYLPAAKAASAPATTASAPVNTPASAPAN